MAKRVRIACDNPILPRRPQGVKAKAPGSVKLTFVSRISPKKNLDWALDLLQDIDGNVVFEIYGPENEHEYAQRCHAIAEKLPGNIRVAWNGPLSYEKVNHAFASAHFFLFPTKGENFGHVIFESLAAGTPVLLSDQTPWTGLPEAGAGWCTPLSNRENWVKHVQHCIEMTQDEYNQMSIHARDYAETWYDANDFGHAILELLRGSHPWSTRLPSERRC
jgi:glycosyltransferase involved in cell wall biosynthesis